MGTTAIIDFTSGNPTTKMVQPLTTEFTIDIPVIDSDSHSHSQKPPKVPQDLIERYQQDGFVVCREVASPDAVAALNDRLEDVLRGHYDRGTAPDKVPRLIKSGKPISSSISSTTTTSVGPNRLRPAAGPLGFSGNLQNVKVLQIINIHKADSLFRKLETSKSLGSLVAQLAGWESGTRLAQDQIWAKPPGAAPLVFHRDSPHFMFDPDEVVTVWFALDDMDEELGPLEYVRGSHRWGDGRVGSANQFFDQNATKLLRSAAEREGINPDTLEILSMAGLPRGSISIHHGKIWHGSGKNESRTRPRRGLGMHFVPAHVRFTSEAKHSRLWKPYVLNVEDPSLVELSEEDFPVTA